MKWFSRGRCYRRGGRYAEEFKVFFSFVLYVETFSFTHTGLLNHRTAQEKLFKYMCNFGARAYWREVIRVVNSYLDVESTRDQFCLLNPTSLDCISGYIMKDDVGDRALKRLPQIKLNLIDDFPYILPKH